MHSKSYASSKAKTTYILGQRVVWTKHNIWVYSLNARFFIPDIFVVAVIYMVLSIVWLSFSNALKTWWSPCLFLWLYVVQVYRGIRAANNTLIVLINYYACTLKMLDPGLLSIVQFLLPPGDHYIVFKQLSYLNKVYLYGI